MNSNHPNLLESLSRLYDGDLPADESRFLLRRLESDSALAAAWSRWSIASVALRRQDQRLLPVAFAEAVHARAGDVTANEGASAARAWQGRPWVRWSAGLAVAASVALIALFANAPDLAEPGAVPGAQVAASNLREADLRPRLNPASTVSAEAVGSLVGFAAEREGLSPELQDYMIRHNAMLQEAGIGGFVPYLDVIAHAPAANGVEGARQ